jgi:hypothetical protein
MREAENEGRAHPLQSVVEAAFAEQQQHDPATLGTFMAGGFTYGVMNAYRAVARDVLEYMAGQRLLKRDSDGWYRRVAGSPSMSSGDATRQRQVDDMRERVQFTIPDAIRLDGDVWERYDALTVAQWREAQHVAIEGEDTHALLQFRAATLLLEQAAQYGIAEDGLSDPAARTETAQAEAVCRGWWQTAPLRRGSALTGRTLLNGKRHRSCSITTGLKDARTAWTLRRAIRTTSLPALTDIIYPS